MVPIESFSVRVLIPSNLAFLVARCGATTRFWEISDLNQLEEANCEPALNWEFVETTTRCWRFLEKALFFDTRWSRLCKETF